MSTEYDICCRTCRGGATTADNRDLHKLTIDARHWATAWAMIELAPHVLAISRSRAYAQSEVRVTVDGHSLDNYFFKEHEGHDLGVVSEYGKDVDRTGGVAK